MRNRKRDIVTVRKNQGGLLERGKLESDLKGPIEKN